MATKKAVNIPNANFVENNEYVNVEEQLFQDNVKGVKLAEIIYCTDWSQVERLFDVFDNNEQWEIEEIDGVFVILPCNCSQIMRNRFEKVKQGELVE